MCQLVKAKVQNTFKCIAHPAVDGTARYRSACALMHILICIDQTCNPASAGL